jgi:hypothetical protein
MVCFPCCALLAMLSLLCSPCYALLAMLSLLCSPCYAPCYALPALSPPTGMQTQQVLDFMSSQSQFPIARLAGGYRDSCDKYRVSVHLCPLFAACAPVLLCHVLLRFHALCCSVCPVFSVLCVVCSLSFLCHVFSVLFVLGAARCLS